MPPTSQIFSLITSGSLAGFSAALAAPILAPRLTETFYGKDAIPEIGKAVREVLATGERIKYPTFETYRAGLFYFKTAGVVGGILGSLQGLASALYFGSWNQVLPENLLVTGCSSLAHGILFGIVSGHICCAAEPEAFSTKKGDQSLYYAPGLVLAAILLGFSLMFSRK